MNGISVNASTRGAYLVISPNLDSNENYTVTVEKGAIAIQDNLKNINNNAFSLEFSTEEGTVIPENPIRIEAEHAVLSGGAVIMDNPDCSNGKYVETREGNLKFSFSITEAKKYKIIAKVKSPDSDKINKFRIDSEHTIDITFPKNSNFEEFIIVDPYHFSEGNHTIEMIKGWGWIHFDYIEITPSSAVEIDFNIQPLVTPQPSPNTAKLHQFLKDNFQHKIISGVMTLKSMATTTGEHQHEISWLYQNTGKKPALMGLDFMDHIGALPAGWLNNPDIIQDAITWKNSNGIVTMCWHWRDPSHKTYEFYTERTDFDARKIFEPQSEEYTAMMRDMDIIADYLKQLKEKDIPILWRPFHEASGRWFWWGAQGPEACKKLWQIMFDKFVNEHKLNNLIWVWTSEANNDALNWYPGDDYVDIIGIDIYEEGNHGSQMMAFNELKKIYNGKKIIALGECGSIPKMESMKKDNTVWAYYMPWYGNHTKNPVWNTVSDWNASLSNPDVITLDKMPANFYER
jgi:mannan endo-1,4-beta-mannosidase